MTAVFGKVAVITGAASGIGRALALKLAAAGAKLAISDIDTAGLADTAQRCEVSGAPVFAEVVDVSDRVAALLHAQNVIDTYGTVHVVFNNAGTSFTGDIEDLSYEQIAHVMQVDFWGMVYGTKAFLPHLIASGGGHIVNASSVMGLFAVPGQGAYNSAKFAVRGFTEALRQEMLVNRRPVQVTCVHPGAIRTEFARHAGALDARDARALAELLDAKARTSPESAARQIIRAVERDKPRALIGTDAKIVDVFIRILGPTYQRILTLPALRLTPPRAKEVA